MLESAALKIDGIRHGFFSRQGGVSGGLYESLNIGLGSKDNRDNVIENRGRVADRLGVARGQLAMPYQCHSADAVIVEAAWNPGEAPRADGLATDRPGLALGISTADCGPVLFADGEVGVVGAAHAGWRGALGGILEATLARMEELGAVRQRIVAVLGPTISQKSYEVGQEFRDIFLKAAPENSAFFIDGHNGRPHFDLPGYIIRRLQQAGIGHADSLGRCTYLEEEMFFSFRRATHRGEPDYGRLVSAIALPGQA